MVLAERNSELVRNGRRSRGPSPNGHGASSGSASASAPGGTGTGTPETSSDDDNSIKRNGKSKTKQSEYEEKIRVGRDYQAVCPPLIPEPERKPECLNDRALLVWSPTKEIPDTKLEEYISVAKEKYGYNGEQALGMLFWHKHDLERAVMDLANFTPFPDEWTVEDKVLFEQAFQFHGKSFHRIRQMLPDKSIASLVKYYYSWKKTRHRQSVMDRQEKVKASKEGSSENGSDNGSNEESDNDDKVQLNKQNISSLKRKNSDNLEEIRPTENANRINARWTNDEIHLAVQGVKKYGRDFQAIAETLGTKTEAHVRNFYLNQRRRYNLDQIIKKHEAEKEAAAGSVALSANAASNSNSNSAASSASNSAPAANSSVSADLPNNTPNSIIKDEVPTVPAQQPTKKKDIPNSVNEESDNTTSSETAISKSTISTVTTTSDERKSESSLSASNLQKDNVIMEIDLDADQPDVTQPPPAKKIALSVATQEFPKSSPA
ncbi:REST corepressor isoform X2 [Stomoxys calcitrans]|uniref:REST corepressor n=1 Tax=Stomoxys calcitrans TaxID=35570 RepID=A0A1I8NWR0_STOCA|nr:REST corepressor isoform X2 [Stomoxys calcitrans]